MAPARVCARPAVAIGVVLACVTAAGSASAQTRRARDVHLFMGDDGLLDATYVAAGASALVVGGLALSPPNVNIAPLDGSGHRAADTSAAAASDVVLLGGMAGSIALSWGIERWGSGSRGAASLRAPLILAESALIATGVVSLLKNAVGACRPRAWSDNEGRCMATRDEDRLSFPSGHTAPLAALAGASLGMYLLPSGRRPEFLPLLAVTSALAGTNVVLRVLAGAHTWVDTSVGFLLGGAVGFATAALHVRSQLPVHVGISAAGPLQFSLGGSF